MSNALIVIFLAVVLAALAVGFIVQAMSADSGVSPKQFIWTVGILWGAGLIASCVALFRDPPSEISILAKAFLLASSMVVALAGFILWSCSNSSFFH